MLNDFSELVSEGVSKSLNPFFPGPENLNAGTEYILYVGWRVGTNDR